jgi:hypothetical protein
VFEFFSTDSELSPRMDLTGAAISASSNIPNFAVPPLVLLDLAQGIIVVPVSEAVSLGAKKFTDYEITVRAVDADAKIHKAVLGVKFK